MKWKLKHFVFICFNKLLSPSNGGAYSTHGDKTLGIYSKPIPDLGGYYAHNGIDHNVGW